MRFLTQIAAGLILITSLAGRSTAAETGKAVVRSVRGAASYSEPGGDWKPLKRGMTLAPSTSVKTGAGGRVELSLGDNGPGLSLFDSTNVRLDRLDMTKNGRDVVTETKLTLTAGTIRGKIRKLPAGATYEVKAPQVTMAAAKTGTGYQVNSQGYVSVQDKGSVSVTYENPASKQTTQYTVEQDQTFVPPKDPAASAATGVVRPTAAVFPPQPRPATTQSPKIELTPRPEPFVSPIHPGR